MTSWWPKHSLRRNHSDSINFSSCILHILDAYSDIWWLLLVFPALNHLLSLFLFCQSQIMDFVIFMNLPQFGHWNVVYLEDISKQRRRLDFVLVRPDWHDSFYLEYNSLVPGRSRCDFKNAIFFIRIFRCSCPHNNLRWTSHDRTDDKSTLAQIKAGCLRATSHYVNQCWPRCLTPYGVTRPKIYTEVMKRDMTRYWLKHCSYVSATSY